MRCSLVWYSEERVVLDVLVCAHFVKDLNVLEKCAFGLVQDLAVFTAELKPGGHPSLESLLHFSPHGVCLVRFVF